MKRVAGLLLAVAAFAAAVAGCGLGAGQGSGDVTITVSRDFGDSSLEPAKTEAVKDETVMELLQRSFDDVHTRFGGGFVQTIDGVSGGMEAGRRVDWFYYVNGIEAQQGAAQRKVYGGDRIWWDHHDWQVAMRIPAGVGAFPEPVLDGSEGRKIPVKLVCAGAIGRSCDEVEQRLMDAKVKAVSRSSLPQSIGRETLRIVVGRWRDIRLDPAAALLEKGPGASGVYARPQPSGRSIALLDARGKVASTLGPGGGLIAATRFDDQEPTWFVTGTDEVGVASAAAALIEDSLRDRFAL